MTDEELADLRLGTRVKHRYTRFGNPISRVVDWSKFYVWLAYDWRDGELVPRRQDCQRVATHRFKADYDIIAKS